MYKVEILLSDNQTAHIAEYSLHSVAREAVVAMCQGGAVHGWDREGQNIIFYPMHRILEIRINKVK